MEIKMHEIGMVSAGESFAVRISPEYRAGLRGLSGFSHVLILWYANGAPEWTNDALVMPKPYRLSPGALGVFATRSPYRPNGLCVSVAAVSSIDEKDGVIGLWWTDAEDGTPVLDVKPYHPSSDLVRSSSRPDWCAHWPASYEDGGAFDWGGEFLF